MEISGQKVVFSTPWFELVSKNVRGQDAPFYALRMSDYVAVVAETEKSELVLVRQFRPALERFTLELPSGHIESGEDAAVSAHRELAEECGFEAPKLKHLGTLLSDTGRHENRCWCYYAPDVKELVAGHTPEPGVERLLVPRSRLPGMIARGEFDFGLHVGALMLAAIRHGFPTAL